VPDKVTISPGATGPLLNVAAFPTHASGRVGAFEFGDRRYRASDGGNGPVCVGAKSAPASTITKTAEFPFAVMSGAG
jgi:hypothetical protein